jgi:hypothetical protein
MQATINTLPMTNVTSKFQTWSGRIVSALAVLFLLMDGAMKVVNIQPVVDASVQLGMPIDLAPKLGALLIALVVVYLIPRTAMLGALLLTGFLGGAVAMQVRIDAPVFSLVFPLILGAMLWGGLMLRDNQARALLLRR